MYRGTRRDFLRTMGNGAVALPLALLGFGSIAGAGRAQPALGTRLEDVLGEYNHVINPTFSADDHGTGWELRYGAGQYGHNLGKVDKYTYHRYPGEKAYRAHASMRLDPSDNADLGIEGEGQDRSIWPQDRIACQPGDKIILSCYAQFQLQGITREAWKGINKGYLSGDPEAEIYWRDRPFWVNEKHIRDFGICPLEYKDKHMNDWADRGGARFGMDFRAEGENELIDDTMVVMDWSNEPERWHHLIMEYIVPVGAATVMPWLQGFEHNAPATVWFDDICLFIERDGELVRRQRGRGS